MKKNKNVVSKTNKKTQSNTKRKSSTKSKKNTKKQQNNKKKINIFSLIFKLIKTAIIIFLVLFSMVICMQRFSDNSLSFLNYRLFSVVTGSMQPKYNIGDVLLCKEAEPQKLKVGDDITYLGNSGTYKNKVVTHRIVKIEKEQNGELLFYTKGIASTRLDPVVKEEQLYGKIIKEVEFLSWLYKFVTTPNGFYICIFIPLVMLVGSEIVVSMVERYEEKQLKG